MLGTIGVRPHHDFPGRSQALFHGVKRVTKRSRINLLQLHFVASHTRQAILAFELDVNIMKDSVAVDQLNDVAMTPAILTPQNQVLLFLPVPASGV